MQLALIMFVSQQIENAREEQFHHAIQAGQTCFKALPLGCGGNDLGKRSSIGNSLQHRE